MASPILTDIGFVHIDNFKFDDSNVDKNDDSDAVKIYHETHIEEVKNRIKNGQA